MTPNRAHALTVFFAATSPPLFPLFLRGGDGLADSTATLPGVQAALESLGTLLDDLGTFGEDKLDVGGVGHVWVDTTVSTVSAPSLLGSLVDLDVLDDQVAGVEALGVGVGLSVLEETDEDLSGLDGPAGLGDTESLALSSASSAASVPPHGNGLLVLQDIS